ncbi:hypothetical protein GH890_32830 [Bacillus thuringiensis]|nr:hypothetical protein [Bacillus thuringiensis]
MLPGILNQLGAENLANLKKIATTVSSGGDLSKPTAEEIDDDDDDVPDLVENFDEASKGEVN